MERLTKRVGVDEAVPICDFDICAPFKKFGKCKTGMQDFPFGKWERHCNDTCVLGRMIDLLADYEDTGLTPEQVATRKWIPVAERLPGKEEYTAKAEDGTEYYVRLLIAYKTDIIEYEIGYYDGYKWMTEMPIRIINDVVAWMPFPNLPQPPKGE